MHTQSEDLLETVFSQGALELETYWSRVAQPRFSGLAVPLTDKDVIRLQKGLQRMSQSHASAVRYYDQSDGVPAETLNPDQLLDLQHAFERKLGHSDVQ